MNGLYGGFKLEPIEPWFYDLVWVKLTKKTMKKAPKFMMIYQCSVCNLDSGMTEEDKPHCYYCDEETEMKLISNKKSLQRSLQIV
jgi:hypothetical protein